MILLGSKVRDKVTGFTGITVSRVEYMTGCIQYGVRPRYNEAEMKGEYPKVEYIDEEQLKKLYPESLEDDEDNGKDWIEKDKKTDNEEEPPGGLQSAEELRDFLKWIKNRSGSLEITQKGMQAIQQLEELTKGSVEKPPGGLQSARPRK